MIHCYFLCPTVLVLKTCMNGLHSWKPVVLCTRKERFQSYDWFWATFCWQSFTTCYIAQERLEKKKLQVLCDPVFPCLTFCSCSERQNLTKAQPLQDNIMYAAPEKPSLEATMSPDMGPVKNNAMNVRASWEHWAHHSNSASSHYCFFKKLAVSRMLTVYKV